MPTPSIRALSASAASSESVPRFLEGRGAVTASLREVACPVPEALAEPVASELGVKEIHHAHADFVWLTLQRLGVRASDLEDALQEVFVVVHRRLSSYDRRAKLSSWLFGISLRVAAQFRRRAHVR